MADLEDEDFPTRQLPPPPWQSLDLTKLRWYPVSTASTPGVTKEILVDGEGQIFELDNDNTPFHYRVDHFGLDRWAYLPDEYGNYVPQSSETHEMTGYDL